MRPDHRMVAHTGLPHPRAPAGQPILNTLDLLLVALRGRRRGRGLPPRVPRPRRVVGRAGARAWWSVAWCSRRCCARSTTPAPPSSCSSPLGILLGTAFVGQALGLLVGAQLHCHVAGLDRALRRPIGRGGRGRRRRPHRRLGPHAAHGGRAGLVRPRRRARRRSPASSTIASRSRPTPSTRSAGSSGEDQFPRVFDALERVARRRPAADLDQHPAAGRRRGRAVHREGRGRRVRPHPGGERVRGRRRPRGHQRARGGRRGRDDPCSAATGPRCAPPSSPSIPTATWPCSPPPTSTGRRSPATPSTRAAWARRSGTPQGGPLRAAPFSVGEITEATGTDIYDRNQIDPRGAGPRRRPPARRLRLRARSIPTATSSASCSPSRSTAPASPTPSRCPSSRPSSPATSRQPVDTGPCLGSGDGRQRRLIGASVPWHEVGRFARRGRDRSRSGVQ